MRRLLLPLLTFALVLVGVAAPASAAPVITSLTANGASDTVTVAPGADVTLAWNVTGDQDLAVVASGAWDGTRPASGTETVDGPAAGESLVFTLTATDGSTETPDTSSVTVTAEEPDGSVPPPVVVADCQVTVPASEEFEYEIVYDGDDEDTEPIDAGTYEVGELTFDGLVDVVIVAVPGRGVTVADGAQTEFPVPYSEDCASASLIEATGGTCSFEVTNISDGPVTVLYGNPEEDQADGGFDLAADQSRTVRTGRESLIVVAFADIDDDDSSFDIVSVRVSQSGCEGTAGDDEASGPRWPIPVGAPAAGLVPTADGSSTPWALLALLLVGAVAGVTRTRATS
jgi:hypothetical protein